MVLTDTQQKVTSVLCVVINCIYVYNLSALLLIGDHVYMYMFTVYVMGVVTVVLLACVVINSMCVYNLWALLHSGNHVYMYMYMYVMGVVTVPFKMV